jgi:L-seryl-tRNA(Ser) seleniumtransferase
MQKKSPKIPESARRLLAKLPAVSRLLESPAVAPLLERYGDGLVTGLLREHLERLRADVVAGRLDAGALDAAVAESSIAEAVAGAAASLVAPRPRPVINATGVVVHTNLGRSMLGPRAAEQVAAAARGYLDLEYDVDEGRRGDRLASLEPLMQRLFPRHAFTVVNNNAAAVLLCLRALSQDQEVLVSRGELVEIGGSFRIPDIMAASGARLREVGTTNRTRLADYEKARSEATGLILKVHTSNFKVVGFTEDAPVRELAGLASRAGVPLVVDWGSGDLVDLEPLGIRDELPVSRLLDDGADLVTFSGDKLLGGPQAGFVVGRDELVSRVRRDPLARVCRLDRLRLGALHQTLVAYVTGRAFEEVPTLRMLAADAGEIDRRARALRDEVAQRTGAGQWIEVVDGVSRTGGGSSPSGERPTRLVSVAVPSGDAGAVERRLRAEAPPIVGRIRDGRLLLDLRTVLPEEEATLAERLAEALSAEIAATDESD